jgi:hypothetical protein
VAFQQIPGGGLWVPTNPLSLPIPAGAMNSASIAATGDAFAWVGRVWFKERGGAKNVQNVGFKFSSITKAGGSGLTVSLQDINLAAGPPIQPDGIKDQTVAIVNANPSFAANTWFQTGNLSATRTVNYGDLIAVVIEFDGAGRLGSDSFQIVGVQPASTVSNMQSLGVTRVSSVYAAFAAIPAVVLGFDDGTFGTLLGALTVNIFGTHAITNATPTANEYAIGVQFPFPVKIASVAFPIILAGGGDFSVMLSGPAGTLQTVPISSHTVVAVNAGGQRLMHVPIPETALAANTLYYVSVRPDTANGITLYYSDLVAAGHMQTRGGGMAWCEYGRFNGGAWNAPVTTRQPLIAVELSAFDDGASGGGGTGGMIQSRVRTGY